MCIFFLTRAVLTTLCRCLVEGRPVLIGNRQWMRENHIDWNGECEVLLARAEGNGETALALALNGVMVAVLALADVPRPDAAKV